MLELDQLTWQFKQYEKYLDEIRTLSKGVEDFYDAPYSDDFKLIEWILIDRLKLMRDREGVVLENDISIHTLKHDASFSILDRIVPIWLKFEQSDIDEIDFSNQVADILKPIFWDELKGKE